MELTQSEAVLRQTSRRQVYRYLYDSARPITAWEAAEALALSPSMAEDCLFGLLGEGMVTCADGETYALEPLGRIAVGISADSGGVTLLAVDVLGEELASRELDVPFAHTPAYYEGLACRLEEFLDDFGLERDRLLGVGLTLPGAIDQAEGRLVSAPALGLRDVPLDELYRHFVCYPFYIENRVHASAYAESWAEGGSMVYLSLDRSVDGALLLEDRAYLGDRGRAGAFGHMRAVPDGRPCSCGRRGCLEAYCSTARLSDDLGLTLDEFFTRLRSGDEKARAVWTEYRGHLLDALATLRACFDCGVVVGGALAPYLEEELPELCRELGEEDDALRPARLGPNSSCIGTALRFIDDFLLTY